MGALVRSAATSGTASNAELVIEGRVYRVRIGELG
jgi:hypothetical protein